MWQIVCMRQRRTSCGTTVCWLLQLWEYTQVSLSEMPDQDMLSPVYAKAQATCRLQRRSGPSRIPEEIAMGNACWYRSRLQLPQGRGAKYWCGESRARRARRGCCRQSCHQVTSTGTTSWQRFAQVLCRESHWYPSSSKWHVPAKGQSDTIHQVSSCSLTSMLACANTWPQATPDLVDGGMDRFRWEQGHIR